MRHDPLEHERASRDFRQIEPEPLGKRGVEIFDVTLCVGSEEACRSAVEVSDCRLHLGEVRLVARTLLCDLVEWPHNKIALASSPWIGRHRLHRDAEPPRSNPRLVLIAGWRQAELLFQAVALLCPARGAKNRTA